MKKNKSNVGQGIALMLSLAIGLAGMFGLIIYLIKVLYNIKVNN